MTLPPRSQELIEDYVSRLRKAGVSENQLEASRELLTPKRGDKPEEEQLLDIEAAWNLVASVARRQGAKL